MYSLEILWRESPWEIKTTAPHTLNIICDVFIYTCKYRFLWLVVSDSILEPKDNPALYQSKAKKFYVLDHSQRVSSYSCMSLRERVNSVYIY